MILAAARRGFRKGARLIPEADGETEAYSEVRGRLECRSPGSQSQSLLLGWSPESGAVFWAEAVMHGFGGAGHRGKAGGQDSR